MARWATGLGKLLVARDASPALIRREGQLWMRFIMQNYFINRELALQRYEPVQPFFGCGGGCCVEPLAAGGCVIAPQLPLSQQDSL